MLRLLTAALTAPSASDCWPGTTRCACASTRPWTSSSRATFPSRRTTRSASCPCATAPPCGAIRGRGSPTICSPAIAAPGSARGARRRRPHVDLMTIGCSFSWGHGVENPETYTAHDRAAARPARRQPRLLVVRDGAGACRCWSGTATCGREVVVYGADPGPRQAQPLGLRARRTARPACPARGWTSTPQERPFLHPPNDDAYDFSRRFWDTFFFRRGSGARRLAAGAGGGRAAPGRETRARGRRASRPAAHGHRRSCSTACGGDAEHAARTSSSRTSPTSSVAARRTPSAGAGGGAGRGGGDDVTVVDLTAAVARHYADPAAPAAALRARRATPARPRTRSSPTRWKPVARRTGSSRDNGRDGICGRSAGPASPSPRSATARGGSAARCGSAPTTRESVRALHRAVDLGVNFIDTALDYGLGHSETLVGRWCASARRRCRRDQDPAEEPRLAGAAGRARVVERFPPTTSWTARSAASGTSGVDHIDLMQLHTWRDELPRPGRLARRASLGLKRAGKVRFLGPLGERPRPGIRAARRRSRGSSTPCR